VVRQALYRPYKDDKPTIDPGLAAELRRDFADEVRRLDDMLDRPISDRWGYSATSQPAADGPHSSPGR